MSLYEKLLDYSFKLLSARRYTKAQIRKKIEAFVKKLMIETGETPAVIEEVIERLIQLKYIDDEQYIKDFVNDRIRFKPRGALFIQKELQAKGIGREKALEVIKDLEIDEYQVALDALNRQRRIWKSGLDEKKLKEKIYRFLASKGFKPGTIYKVIKTCYT